MTQEEPSRQITDDGEMNLLAGQLLRKVACTAVTTLGSREKEQSRVTKMEPQSRESQECSRNLPPGSLCSYCIPTMLLGFPASGSPL